MSALTKCDRCGNRLVAGDGKKAMGHQAGCFYVNRVRYPEVLKVEPSVPRTRDQRTALQRAADTLGEFNQLLHPGAPLRTTLSPARAKVYLADQQVRALLTREHQEQVERAINALQGGRQ